MTPRIPDRIDAENVFATLNTGGWELIEHRIRNYEEQTINALMTPQDERATNVLRGEIRAIRTILSLPQRIISEGKANGEKAR